AANPVATALQTFRITVRDDDVRVTTNSGLAVSESAGATSLKGHLVAGDDTPAEATTLTYAVTALPRGTLTVNGTAVTAVGATFTQADLDAGRVTYTPTGGDGNVCPCSSLYRSAADPPATALQTFPITVRDDDVRVTTNSGL